MSPSTGFHVDIPIRNYTSAAGKRNKTTSRCTLCTQFKLWETQDEEDCSMLEICMLEEFSLGVVPATEEGIREIPNYTHNNAANSKAVAQQNFDQNLALHLLNPFVQQLYLTNKSRSKHEMKPYQLLVALLYFGYRWTPSEIVFELYGRDVWDFGSMPNFRLPRESSDWLRHAEQRIIFDINALIKRKLGEEDCKYKLMDLGLELGAIVCSQLNSIKKQSEFAMRLPDLFTEPCIERLREQWGHQQCRPKNLFINGPPSHPSHPGLHIKYEDLNFNTSLMIHSDKRDLISYIIKGYALETDKKALLKFISTQAITHIQQS